MIQMQPLLKFNKQPIGLSLILVLFIKDNYNLVKDMEMEYKYGQMDQNMLGSGKKIEHMEREYLHILMEIYMMENGLKEEHKDMVHIKNLKEVSIQEIGIKMSLMGMVLRNGHKVIFIKVIIMKDQKMEKEYIFGLMDQAMKGNGIKVKLKEKESTCTKMVGNMKVIGKII